jgi:hypothetical protein
MPTRRRFLGTVPAVLTLAPPRLASAAQSPVPASWLTPHLPAIQQRAQERQARGDDGATVGAR